MGFKGSGSLPPSEIGNPLTLRNLHSESLKAPAYITVLLHDERYDDQKLIPVPKRSMHTPSLNCVAVKERILSYCYKQTLPVTIYLYFDNLI